MTENELEKLFPFKRNYINIGSLRIHYVDEGGGDNVIILFHACPMWSFSFRHIINHLMKSYRVIALDLPGFGLSDKPDDFEYTLSGYIDIVEQFITVLGVNDMSFILHGWGGTVGMGYAVRHPRQIKSLVVMNSMAFSDYHLPWRLYLCRTPWLGPKIVVHLNILQSGGYRHLPKDIRDAYSFPFEKDSNMESLVKFAELIPTAPESDAAQTILSIEGGLWMFRLKNVCIIWAMKDWLYPGRALKVWHKRLPNAEIHSLESAGRYMCEEAPDTINAILDEFYSKSLSAGGDGEEQV